MRRWLPWAMGLLSVAVFFVFRPLDLAQPHVIFLARIVAAMSLGLVTVLLSNVGLWRACDYAHLDDQKKAFYREWSGQGLASFVLLNTWLVGQWPGFLEYDALKTYRILTEFRLNEWSSSLYSLYLCVSQQIFPSPGWLAEFQIVMVSVAVSYFFSDAIQRGVDRRFVRGGLLLFLLLPLNGAMTVSLGRDTLFSWLFLATALFIPWYKFNCAPRPTPRLALLVTYSVLLVATAKLRAEGLVLFLVIPPCLIYVCGWSRRALLQFCALGLAWSACVFVALPLWVPTHPLGRAYTLTTILNPLGYMIRNNYVTADRDHDRQIIDQVVDYSVLAESFSPIDILPLYKGAIRNDFGATEFHQLILTYAKMVAQNPTLFLANRWRMFSGVMRFTQGTTHISNDLENDDPYLVETRHILNLKKEPLLGTLHDWQAKYIWWALDSGSFRRAASANWAATFILFFALAFYRSAPATAAVGLIFAVRLALIFLLAPSAQFKYVYGFYLLGFFLPLVLLMELRLTRPTRN